MSDIKHIIRQYYPNYEDFSMFEKYVDNISHAEFHTAVCQCYIMDKDIKNLKITLKTHKETDCGMYY